jgi:hypothetical protein
MAPINPNNTGRYFVDYTCGPQEHTSVCRANAVVSPAGFGTLIDAILTGAAPIMYAITLNRVRWAAAGSNVSNIVTTGFEGTVYGTATPPTNDVPKYLNFVGRSPGGRRVRFALFSFENDISSYRLHSAEDLAIAYVVSLLNSSPNAFLAVDGLKAQWYPYANTGFNAYWQREVRS